MPRSPTPIMQMGRTRRGQIQLIVWVLVVTLFLALGGDDLLAWIDRTLRARAGN